MGHWVHLGTLVAAEDSRIHNLDARKFQEIVCQFEHLSFDPRKYAQKFIDALNASTDARLDAITDLSIGTEGSFLDDDESDRRVSRRRSSTFSSMFEHGIQS